MTGALEQCADQGAVAGSNPGEGNSEAVALYEERLQSGSADPRPLMGTEIEFLNKLLLRKSTKIGLASRANERPVDIVTKVEQPDPRHITALRLT